MNYNVSQKMGEKISWLAALLHDSGKFRQCISERGEHLELGHRFIETYEPKKGCGIGFFAS
jgi:hypothetical protein